MLKELRAGLYNLLISNCPFHTGMPFVFWKIAPQGQLLPYCVFDRFAQAVTRDSASKFEAIRIQVNLYRDIREQNYSVKLNDDEDNLTSLLDDADLQKTLVVNGYTLVRVNRLGSKELGIDNGVAGVSVQFEFEIQR